MLIICWKKITWVRYYNYVILSAILLFREPILSQISIVLMNNRKNVRHEMFDTPSGVDVKKNVYKGKS